MYARNMSNLFFYESDSSSSSNGFSNLLDTSRSRSSSSSSSGSTISSSDSSLFHFRGGRSSRFEEDHPIPLMMDDSHNQSTSEDESRNQSNATDGEASSPLTAGSLSTNVSRMLEDIGSIQRYCENVAAQMGVEGSSTNSSPTRVGSRQRVDVNPVEVIDLSAVDFVRPARPSTNRSPVAVIDLCTPDRSHAARPPVLASGRNFQPSNTTVVDLDDPSPPKRVCTDANQAQKRESYKCPVCLECVSIREPVSTKCGHVFCKQCLVSALSSLHKCPLCNKKMTCRQFSRIYI